MIQDLGELKLTLFLCDHMDHRYQNLMSLQQLKYFGWNNQKSKKQETFCKTNDKQKTYRYIAKSFLSFNSVLLLEM